MGATKVLRDVGFTGTSKGLSDSQRAAIRVELERLRSLGAEKFAHGCCVEADADAAKIARELGYRLVGLPAFPLGDRRRADVANDVELAIAKPLVRNRRIANLDVLVAASRTEKELLRSGTWATVRYARSARTPIVFVYPDGRVERTTEGPSKRPASSRPR